MSLPALIVETNVSTLSQMPAWLIEWQNDLRVLIYHSAPHHFALFLQVRTDLPAVVALAMTVEIVKLFAQRLPFTFRLLLAEVNLQREFVAIFFKVVDHVANQTTSDVPIRGARKVLEKKL